MQINFLFLFILLAVGDLQAQTLFMPNADFRTIVLAAEKAQNTPVNELKGAGPISFQVIYQIIMNDPDPREFPFIGYGQNEDEAKDRAGLLCMKYQLEHQDVVLEKKISAQIEGLRAMSLQKFGDHLNAVGGIVSGVDESMVQRNVFKNWDQGDLRCKKMASSFRMVIMHARCASTGFLLLKNPQIEDVDQAPRKSHRRHVSDSLVESFTALATSAECAHGN
ncbi:MAG: hypothetical protein A4S09_10700 [Proteobacteria bacterium SG_bin7]|nr:MAG: hypothetical protein A4S09_10700 [Proteobacteria bacterium SG_bin7]